MFFVVNRHAGGDKARRIFSRLRPLLTEDDAFQTTQSAGDGRRIAREASEGGHEIVVAVGGDGTVSEVANGLADAGFKPALGIIPAGGGNDLAYTLGLPRDPERALRLLRGGRTRAIDTGKVVIAGGETPRYFVNIFGMGVTGSMAALTQGEKPLGGRVTYGVLVLRELFRFRNVRFSVSVEGEAICEQALSVELANGKREGSMFVVAPSARPDDGLLDMVAVRNLPLRRRPWFLVQTLRNRVLEQPDVEHRLVHAATVRARDPLPCHADGESFTLPLGVEAEIEVMQGALRVVGPETRGG